jgi:hypothetical protein
MNYAVFILLEKLKGLRTSCNLFNLNSQWVLWISFQFSCYLFEISVSMSQIPDSIGQVIETRNKANNFARWNFEDFKKKAYCGQNGNSIKKFINAALACLALVVRLQNKNPTIDVINQNKMQHEAYSEGSILRFWNDTFCDVKWSCAVRAPVFLKTL